MDNAGGGMIGPDMILTVPQQAAEQRVVGDSLWRYQAVGPDRGAAAPLDQAGVSASSCPRGVVSRVLNDPCMLRFGGSGKSLPSPG